MRTHSPCCQGCPGLIVTILEDPHGIQFNLHGEFSLLMALAFGAPTMSYQICTIESKDVLISSARPAQNMDRSIDRLHSGLPGHPPFQIPPRVLTLALERRRTRRRVAGRLGIVNVDQQSRVVGRVGAREGDLLGLRSARTAGDGDLGTRQVQLRSADGARAVQGDVLRTKQVLAILDARRDWNVDSRGACLVSLVANGAETRGGGFMTARIRTLRRPSDATFRDAWVVLVDLEPVGARAVVGGCRLAGGHLRQPRGEWAWVANAGLDAVRNRRAGLYCGGGGSLVAGRQLIASHGGRIDIRHRAIALVVGCLADVAPVSLQEKNVLSVSDLSHLPLESLVLCQIHRPPWRPQA